MKNETTTAAVIDRRYDFLYLFDVKDGNPNGDPDLANTPRFDPETFQGLVSDVCLKRKIRNYALALKSQTGAVEPGYDVFVLEGQSLEERQQMPYQHLEALKGKAKDKETTADDIVKARAWMCEHFFDVRVFGAVMSTTKYRCGQVRGPVQITFARSFDRILSTEHGITRVAYTTQAKKEDKVGSSTEMGNKHTVAYGLYAAHGFVNAGLARQTGFNEEDLKVLWKALGNMFELDRSAARGMMAARHCFVFEHESALGEAPAHKLFDLIESRIKLREGIESPRAFADYIVPAVSEIQPLLPKGVTLSDIVGD